MRRLRQTFKTTSVILLTFLWVLASNHCALEQVVGLAFLACEDHEAATQAPSQGCEGDSCLIVESQLYKVEDAPVTAVAPQFLLAAFLIPPPAEPSDFHPGVHARLDVSPPELPRLWRFAQRTALPPRAPSIAS